MEFFCAILIYASLYSIMKSSILVWVDENTHAHRADTITKTCDRSKVIARKNMKKKLSFHLRVTYVIWLLFLKRPYFFISRRNMPKKLIPLVVLIVAWNSFQKVEKVKERVAKSQPFLFINLHFGPILFVDNNMLLKCQNKCLKWQNRLWRLKFILKIWKVLFWFFSISCSKSNSA